MTKKIMVFLKANYLILLIILLSLLLRFWNFWELIHFTFDEELEAFIVKNIATFYHFPAIGISVAPVGIHLSPVFYYLASIPFYIGNLNPFVWGMFASALGVFTTWVVYYTNLRLFNKTVGVIASLLYASSFLMVLYDKHFWNVLPMPILSIATVYCLLKIKEKKYRWYIVLATIISIGISSHLSSLVLVILSIWTIFKDKLSLLRKEAVIGLMIILISQFPLAFFEFRHDFYQSKVLGKFFVGEHSGFDIERITNNVLLLPKTFSRLLYTFGSHDFAREHTYGLVEIAQRDGRIPPGFILIAGILLLTFLTSVWIFKKNENDLFGLAVYSRLLVTTLVSLVFYGILFNGSLFEFYLALAFPIFFSFIGYFLYQLFKVPLGKMVVLGMMLIFFVVNLFAIFTAFHSYGLSRKVEMIDWVKQNVGDKEYSLYSIGVDHKYEGYRYLFERFYKEPNSSYMDQHLGWLYQNPPKAKSTVGVVIVSNEPFYKEDIEKEKEKYRSVLDKKKFGEIEVLIIENEK